MIRPPGPYAPPLAKGELPPKKVAWFHPPELLRTAYHAWLSNVATEYLDRRETLAALDRTSLPDRGYDDDVKVRRHRIALRHGDFIDAFIDSKRSLRLKDDGVWLDFLADIGDSWQATYAVATMLAQPELEVRGHPNRLPCADVVVLGGDLVYPTPTRDGYRRRTCSPLSAALPEPDLVRRTLLAIPGNHDWYDGLTNFIRTFCQGGFLGGWRLLQRRSYFAVKLMKGWWIWGIDIALDTRIDPPQQAYFLSILQRRHQSPKQQEFREGDNIILCTAEPSWVETSRYSDDSYRNLAYFVREIIERNKGRVPIILTGDLHHYYRYASGDGHHMIISGGGGAYLMGTHNMPPQVPAPKSGLSGADEPHDRRSSYVAGPFPYPGEADSRRLALGALLLAFRPANWLFSVLVGTLYLFLILTLRRAMAGMSRQSLQELFGSPLLRWRGLMKPAVPAVVVVGTVLVICVAFAIFANRRSSRVLTGIWGLAHGVVHIGFGLILASLIGQRLTSATISAPMFAVLAGAVIVFAGVAGATLVGAYLTISDRFFGWHTNEVFAAQSLIDYRNFVRMHISPDGLLSLFPIGLRRVPRKWRSRSERKGSGPYYEPVDDELAPHLIEGPIHIKVPPRP